MKADDPRWENPWRLTEQEHKAMLAEIAKLRAAIRNMLDAIDCNDEIAAHAYAKTALGNEQRVTGEG